MLELRSVVTGYGQVPVVHGVDLAVRAGELLTVIGANGAGKSSLLRTISGVNSLFSGSISLEGESIGGWPSARIAARGIVHVPENRRVFASRTVQENLRLGAYPIRHRVRGRIDQMLESVYGQFPRLSERRSQLAGSMSGGEQQILAIAMGLMAEPKLLMLDEPSLGLAPVYVDRVFEEIAALKAAGTTILLVEQLASRALALADRAVVLQHGRVVLEGPAAELAHDPSVRAAYLGSEETA